MTQQYKDFITTVDIDIQPEVQRSADRYYRSAMTIKISALLLLLLAITFSIFDSKYTYPIYGIAFILVFLYFGYKKWNSRKIRNILLKDCEPARILSFYTALISHSRRNINWDLHFYNTCSSLYYAGRFEDVKKVLTLFPKYCPDNSSRFKYNLIWARLAYHEKDETALSAYCENLDKLAKIVNPKGFFRFAYMESMLYPRLLELENNKEYQLAYDMSQQKHYTYYKSILAPVKVNYFQYRMASAMGNQELAEQHKDFVLKNGGTLWYKQELEVRI